MPAQRFTLSARLRSFRYAFRGLRLMLATQHNAWLHTAAAIIVITTGLGLGLSRTDWCLLTLAIVAVLSAEAFNTAFEFLCDVASPDFHPLVEKAKDVSAAAVLVTAAGAVIVGLFVFVPHFSI